MSRVARLLAGSLLAGTVSLASAAEKPAAPLDVGEHDVELNGVRIHYTVAGTGPVMIAHSGGPGMDARTWGDFAGLTEDLTIVTLHPRGSGLSGPAPDGEYRIEHYVGDLEALREHLGVERPALIGWSHGGVIAQAYAAAHPASVSKLILMSTSARFAELLGDIESAVTAFRDEPWYPDAYAALQDEWAGNFSTDEEMNELWLREAKFYFAEYDERAEAYIESTKPLVPIRIAALAVFNEQEAMTMDLRPELAKITAPTLVIAGRHDFITTVAMAEDIVANVANAELVVFESSGHFSVVEEPERFREVVRGFVLGE